MHWTVFTFRLTSMLPSPPPQQWGSEFSPIHSLCILQQGEAQGLMQRLLSQISIIHRDTQRSPCLRFASFTEIHSVPRGNNTQHTTRDNGAQSSVVLGLRENKASVHCNRLMWSQVKGRYPMWTYLGIVDVVSSWLVGYLIYAASQTVHIWAHTL